MKHLRLSQLFAVLLLLVGVQASTHASQQYGPFPNFLASTQPDSVAKRGGGDPLKGLNIDRPGSGGNASVTLVSIASPRINARYLQKGNTFIIDKCSSLASASVVSNPITVSSVTYIAGFGPSGSFDGADTTLVITTIFGLDLNPGNPTYDMGGFDPISPQAAFSDEAFVGNSGTVYQSNGTILATANDLATLLPTADLSVFQNADPTSRFYAFQATVPTQDFVPVPTASNDHPRFIRPVAILTAYPNPFNPATTLKFYLAEPGHARVEVFSLDGRLVNTLFDGHRDAGDFVLSWTGRDSAGRPVSSGAFICRIVSKGASASRALVLIK